MTDDDLGKIIVFTLGVLGITFVVGYLIYTTKNQYKLPTPVQQPTQPIPPIQPIQQPIPTQQPIQQQSLTNDPIFQLERRVHDIEYSMRGPTYRDVVEPPARNPRIVPRDLTQENPIIAPAPIPVTSQPIPVTLQEQQRTKVSLNNQKSIQRPNIASLSLGEQDKIRRAYFGML